MLIATFGPSTGWSGKTITQEGGAFTLEGHGTVTAQDVLAYDEKGQLIWAYDGLREWVQQLATVGAVAALQIPPIEATPPLMGSKVTGKPKRPLYRRWWVYVVGVFVLLFAIGAISNAVNPPKKPHPVAMQTAATTPTQTPSPPSTLPSIGKRTTASQCSRTSRRNPRCSPPKTSATGPV